MSRSRARGADVERGVLGVARLCAHDGCDTMLSRYNRTRWCAVHERLHPPKHVGSWAGAGKGQPQSAVTSEEPEEVTVMDADTRSSLRPETRQSLDTLIEGLRDEKRRMEEELAAIEIRKDELLAQLPRITDAIGALDGSAGVQCRHPGCDRRLKDKRAEATHYTRMHGRLAKADDLEQAS
jgi:hypothetical protein